MVELQDITRKLQALSNAIKTEAPKAVDKMALTGKSLVNERIIREGFGAEYSNNYVPAWFLRGKERNAKGRKYLEENNLDDDLVNWSEFREAQGLQNDHVDLNYTGRMWAGVTIIERSSSGNRFIARLGGTDREVDKKLGWNSERYGDFMQPNASEQKEVDLIAENFFDNLIKKYLK